MVQWVKYHRDICILNEFVTVPAVLPLSQFLANAPVKKQRNMQILGKLHLYGSPKGSSWLYASPILEIMGVNKWMQALSLSFLLFLSVTKPLKQIHFKNKVTRMGHPRSLSSF